MFPFSKRRMVVTSAVIVGLVCLAIAGLGGRGDPALGLGAAASASPALAPPGPLGSLRGKGPWLNGPPLRAEDLRGKVVLVNFWTYSCINSLRPLPYVRTWASKYKNRGLVVIGVHTPEFGFEKDLANVRRAVAGLGIAYPVVLDSDSAIWRAFDNQAWPAFYFIGADGRVHGQKLGEGDYDQSERLLQKLMSQAGGRPVDVKIVPIAGSGPQAAPDWRDLASEETYVGFAKGQGFASEGGLKLDRARLYQSPSRLARNTWSLGGRWTVGGEFATLSGASGAITYRFHARDLNLVLAPPADGRAVRFRVRIDGAVPGPDHGFDVDSQGWGRVQDARLYQLVRQTRSVADRTFEIEFFDPGVRAYVFTFG